MHMELNKLQDKLPETIINISATKNMSPKLKDASKIMHSTIAMMPFKWLTHGFMPLFSTLDQCIPKQMRHLDVRAQRN